jgi:hypothetical protein
MSWHGDTMLFEAYATGEIDGARALSLEAHLLECGSCRDGVARAADLERLEDVWTALSQQLDAPHPTLVERSLRLFGVPDHVARLLAATPSLRLSWFGAIAIALGFAVAAAHAGTQGILVFLLVAPLVPVAGVATAYGRGMDPTYEIGVAAPMRGLRLLLLRSVAVLCASLVLGGAAALALPTVTWTSAAWLLPSLALSATTLALSTVWPPMVAAASVGLAWIAIVVAAESLSSQTFAAVRPPGQLASIVVLSIAVVVLLSRRERLESRR